MRTAKIQRDTAETKIALTLNLDGTGESRVETGCGFLDHMLTLFAAHSRFDLILTCRGDVQVDDHHTVEDIGICLGQAFAQALGEKRGIVRYGSMLLPMDETLVLCAADCSGRSFLVWDVTLPAAKIGSFDTELGREFFLAFVRASGVTLHLRQLTGTNTHHILEACFKAFARALGQAVSADPRLGDRIPSTKGVL